MADVPQYQKPEQGYIRMFPQYQKPERGYMRMFPSTKNQNEGAFAKTALLRNRPFVILSFCCFLSQNIVMFVGKCRDIFGDHLKPVTLKPVIRIFRIFRVFASAFSVFSAFSVLLLCGVSSNPYICRVRGAFRIFRIFPVSGSNR